MSARRCANCSDGIAPGAGQHMEVDGLIVLWCDECAETETERTAELEHERLLGVYKGDEDMGQPRFESFEGDDRQWWWRELGGNGEETGRSTEGYTTKEHADRGIDDAIAEAQQVAEAEGTADTEPDAKGP